MAAHLYQWKDSEGLSGRSVPSTHETATKTLVRNARRSRLDICTGVISHCELVMTSEFQWRIDEFKCSEVEDETFFHNLESQNVPFVRLWPGQPERSYKLIFFPVVC